MNKCTASINFLYPQISNNLISEVSRVCIYMYIWTKRHIPYIQVNIKYRIRSRSESFFIVFSFFSFCFIKIHHHLFLRLDLWWSSSSILLNPVLILNLYLTPQSHIGLHTHLFPPCFLYKWVRQYWKSCPAMLIPTSLQLDVWGGAWMTLAIHESSWNIPLQVGESISSLCI